MNSQSINIYFVQNNRILTSDENHSKIKNVQKFNVILGDQ